MQEIIGPLKEILFSSIGLGLGETKCPNNCELALTRCTKCQWWNLNCDCGSMETSCKCNHHFDEFSTQKLVSTFERKLI